VADQYNSHVVHFSSTGEQLFRARGFDQPTALAVDPADGACWVADRDHNEIVRLAADGTEQWRAAGFAQPMALALNPTDGTCWVSDTMNDAVVHLAATGATLWHSPAEAGFWQPEGLAVNPGDGSVWVADTQHNQVVHLDAAGTQLWRGGRFSYPSAISVNTSDGSCYVADTWNSQVALVGPDSTFDDVPFYLGCFEEVEACVAADFVKGYNDDLYHPKWTVNRDQMAVYVSRALAGGEANVPTGPATPSFTDVPTTFWAYDHIEYAVARGVVKGYAEDNTYRPSKVVTRAFMAAFIARARADGEANVPDPGCTEPPFPDVPCDHWARRYVQYLKEEGVVMGYPDGLYHPDANCTRDQMAIYIARAFDLVP
jgi:DNA-binding beta-propeller fold protein YncE